MSTQRHLLVVLSLAVVLSPSVALADNPTEKAHGLLPLESRALSAEYTVGSFDTVANQINQAVTPSAAEQDTLTSFVEQLPLINDLLDERGNLDLPMGITVFSTMGDPSVGFGTDF